MIRIVIDVDENRKSEKKMIIISFQTKDLKYSEASSAVFEMKRLIDILSNLKFEDEDFVYDIEGDEKK